MGTNDAAATPTVDDLLAHAAWARRLARTLVGEGDSDDLVQETWMAALRERPDAGATAARVVA